MKKYIFGIGVFIVIVVLIVYFFFGGDGNNKTEAIKNVMNNYYKVSKETNYCFKSKYIASNTIKEVWKKDNICFSKMSDDKRTIYVLDDEITHKEYTIDENNKKYRISDIKYDSNLTVLPIYDFAGEIGAKAKMFNEKECKYLIEDKDLKITSGNYKGKECYIAKYGSMKNYIEKSTGILIAKYILNELTYEVEYSIGTVTDDDVKFDFTGYKLVDQL